MDILSQLFGKKPSVTCEKCGSKGNLFLPGGAYDGQFKTLGKDSRAYLIIECIKCGSRYTYDPIWGKVQEYDELKEVAKQEFGIEVGENNSGANSLNEELKEYREKEKEIENKRISKVIAKHRKAQEK